jgi:hypothetical protein
MIILFISSLESKKAMEAEAKAKRQTLKELQVICCFLSSTLKHIIRQKSKTKIGTLVP